MPQKHLKTWQKATALVPLALLSGAWTASLASTNAALAATENDAHLPDGTSIPNQTVEAPASVSVPGEIAPGVPAGAADSVIAGSSANGIPAVALAAYQRAAQVIDSADPSCKISWPLIAAIGRVESDHGRYDGNVLTEDGTSRPGIYGIPLDGSNGTARIADTDAGQYDNDPVNDRAVGPMQFIPSTWSVVGVDGDGDGKRDPQDINDAALATAVYLCSGDENLSTTTGQRASVYRYNHSQDYVNLVLSIMSAYSDGDYSAVPTSVAGTTTFGPSYKPFATAGMSSTRKHKDGHTDKPRAHPSGVSAPNGSSTTSSPTPGATPSTKPTPKAPAVTDPKDPVKKADDPVKELTDTATKAAGGAQVTLISAAQAATLCTAELKSQFGVAPEQAVSTCADQLNGKTLVEAQASVAGIVSGLSSLVTGLIGGSGGSGGLLGGLGG